MKNLSLTILILTFCFSLKAQDPRERYYNYRVLKPSHTAKEKVAGWAEERVSEPLNRGLVAIETSKGIYFSWRLLNSDSPETSFNIYAENGKSEKKTE